MGVAMAKPHPHVINNAYPGTWRQHAIFWTDYSFDLRLPEKKSYGRGYDKMTHITTLFDTHPGFW